MRDTESVSSAAGERIREQVDDVSVNAHTTPFFEDHSQLTSTLSI